MVTLVFISLIVYLDKKKDPDRGRKRYHRQYHIIQLPNKIKRKTPIGDGNSLLHSIFEIVPKIKRKTPIGDGNHVVGFSLVMVLSEIKRKTPIGDGNSSGIKYSSLSTLR